MKKLLNFSLLLLLSVFGIHATSKIEKAAFVTGTYGISEPINHLVLTVNANNTFHYSDKTVADRIMDVRGKWKRDGNTIVLYDYVTNRPIHSRWKIDSEYPCLHARKALEWRRLCLLRAE